MLACENTRFSSLFAAGDVSRETSPATKSEEKRMFSQANKNAKRKANAMYGVFSGGSKPSDKRGLVSTIFFV